MLLRGVEFIDMVRGVEFILQGPLSYFLAVVDRSTQQRYARAFEVAQLRNESCVTRARGALLQKRIRSGRAGGVGL